MTPNVIRYLLTMQDIKTIDFSEAEMDCDVEIDLGFKMVVNKDVDIIPNEHIDVEVMICDGWFLNGNHPFIL